MLSTSCNPDEVECDITIIITNNKICDADIYLNDVFIGTLEPNYYFNLTRPEGFYNCEASISNILCSDESASMNVNCGETFNFSID